VIRAGVLVSRRHWWCNRRGVRRATRQGETMVGRAVALSFLIAVIHLDAPLSAQRNMQETPLPPIGGQQTLFEQFADRLDLNGRTQRPEAEKIFTAAAAEALPVAQHMNQLRVRLVNAEIEGNAAEVKTIVEEYAGVAAQMAEMEADAFAKVYAMLTPAQQKRATQAFDIIAGVFVPIPSTLPARGGGGARGGRGGA
jgi:hypothetical protein